jgi:flavin-dependent dehydrogenase
VSGPACDLGAKEREFDVAIVGAGPAGSATGLALAKHGLQVCLLDATDSAARRVGETLRASATRSLDALGLLDAFRAEGHAHAYARRSAWGSPEPQEMPAIANPYGPSFHLDRSRFDRFFCNAAREAGVKLFVPARVHRVTSTDGGISLEIEYERARFHLRARFTVDATGASGWLGRRFAAERFVLQHLVGVARWYRDTTADPVTVIESTEHGFWYSAPLPNAELVAVWITDAKHPSARAGRSDSLWEEALRSAPLTRGRVAENLQLGESLTRPCGPACCVGGDPRGWLPVGDAALTFDPIAGEGLEHALASALSAAQALLATHAGSRDAIVDYRNGLLLKFVEHARQRDAVYRLEQRWPHSMFWQRTFDSVHRVHK